MPAKLDCYSKVRFDYRASLYECKKQALVSVTNENIFVWGSKMTDDLRCTRVCIKCLNASNFSISIAHRYSRVSG